jgi:hypothetical protein
MSSLSPLQPSTSNKTFRFDQVRNEWNYSEELNIKGNRPSDSPIIPAIEFCEPDLDEPDFSLLEDGELEDQTQPSPEEEAPPQGGLVVPVSTQRALPWCFVILSIRSIPV